MGEGRALAPKRREGELAWPNPAFSTCLELCRIPKKIKSPVPFLPSRILALHAIVHTPIPRRWLEHAPRSPRALQRKPKKNNPWQPLKWGRLRSLPWLLRTKMQLGIGNELRDVVPLCISIGSNFPPHSRENIQAYDSHASWFYVFNFPCRVSQWVQ